MIMYVWEGISVNQLFIDELVAGLKSIFLEDLVSVILYGSVARGTETIDSDIDIAILLRSVESREKMDRLDDLAVDMDLKFEKVISIVDIDYNEYLKWQDILPFYRNVKNEGVVLWKAA